MAGGMAWDTTHNLNHKDLKKQERQLKNVALANIYCMCVYIYMYVCIKTWCIFSSSVYILAHKINQIAYPVIIELS